MPTFNIWHQQTSIFDKVAGFDFGGAGLNLTGVDHPLQVQAIHVTGDFFAMLGAPVIAGRTFTAAEDSPNGRTRRRAAKLRLVEDALPEGDPTYSWTIDPDRWRALPPSSESSEKDL